MQAGLSVKDVRKWLGNRSLTMMKLIRDILNVTDFQVGFGYYFFAAMSCQVVLSVGGVPF